VPAADHRGQVTVVGSLNIDRIVTLSRFPQPGETTAASTSTTAFGGKGANQATAAAALRVPTRLIGAVGDDVDGARMIASLQESGVDCGGVQRLPTDSGSAFVQVDSSGENQIIIAAGANGELSPSHVKRCLASLASADRSEANVLLVSLEVPDEAVGAAIEAGRAAGCIVVLNPAPYRQLSRGVYALCDIASPNLGELAQMLSLPTPTPNDLEAFLDAVAGRLDKDARIVVTLGQHGYAILSHNQCELLSGEVTPPVSTVGAGDAFNGALAAALASALPLRQAAQIANRAGALAVSLPTARVNRLAYNELAAHLQQQSAGTEVSHVRRIGRTRASPTL
jgi:ribokinase